MNIKNLNIVSLLFLTCGVFGSSANLPAIPQAKAWRGGNPAGKTAETSFKPVPEERSIRFGTKVIQMNPDGKVTCANAENGQLLSCHVYFWLVQDGKPNWDWQSRHLDRQKSRLFRNGNKYTWELWYGSPDVPSFEGVHQELEVLPDGRIQLSARLMFPAKQAGREFKNSSLGLSLPDYVWKNETVEVNGKSVALNDKTDLFSRAPVTWDFGRNSPSRRFTLSLEGSDKSRTLWMSYRPGNQSYQIMHSRPKDGNDVIRLYLDFRKGKAQAGDQTLRGGVNFRLQENLELPDNSRKNLIANPSFERGLEGWHWPSAILYCNNNGQWGWKPYSLDETVAYDGHNSLRMEARAGNHPAMSHPNLGPLQVVAEPGTYTLSFYAKAQPGKKSRIFVWIPNFHSGSIWQAINGNTARWDFELTDQWKRYQAVFPVKKGEPLLSFGFFGYDRTGDALIWMDAVQLEKGQAATAYQAPPAEGRLITSAPDNFISSQAKIDGRLRITTAKPDMAGQAHVTVKNFFGEILLDRRWDFRTGAGRTAELALPLDDLPGLGVFVLKAEYKLSDGTAAYDFRRYSHVKFLDKFKGDQRMYGICYSNPAMRFDFPLMMERWRKLGVGAKHHVLVRTKAVWDEYEKYGVKPYIGNMLSYMRNTTGAGGFKMSHFFVLDTDKPYWVQDLNDKNILVRDFHLDSNGTITPEYLAKVKQACKTLAAKYPHIKLWSFGGELSCKLPNDWWGKGATDKDVAHMVAQLNKAFAEGVREGNPEAKIFQGDPANMSQWGGISETDLLLGECNKLGVKFDVIAIHPYRFSPENPDLDSDTEKLLKMLKKHGYDKTPVLWPEGMHWGPFDIPQWGTKSSSWIETPVTWRGTLSYDMGWTEKKSAAWYARDWLVALKYSDRIFGATAGMVKNNCYMDMLLTPYAAQLIPNTLCSVLSGVKFKKDIRFLPQVRTYVFEDAQKRPVAAVWCHKESVDSGREDAPVVSADFGTSLESVTDLMNSPRAFKPGRMEFPVSSFPLFFRGKPGTLKQMIAAFEQAEPVAAGQSVLPVALSIDPLDRNTMRITVRNFISREFNGQLNGRKIRVPASGQAQLDLPLKTPLKPGEFRREMVPVKLRSDRGREYDSQFAFNVLTAGKVSDRADIDTLDWNKLPAVPFPPCKGNKTASGSFRLGWNRLGLFIEAAVNDPTFLHVEYPQPAERWKNDCLQIYFDTFANARQRTTPGYDEDDYDYAVFPNSKGTAAQVFRFQTVDSQLGLATQAPPDKTFAPDIPCRFSNKDGVLTYRVFFPAKYLLPMKLQKGWVFGLGLFTMDSNQRGKAEAGLTLADDGKGCWNRPHTWPAVVLTD